MRGTANPPLFHKQEDISPLIITGLKIDIPHHESGSIQNQIAASRSASAKPAITPEFMAGRPGAGLLFMKNIR